MTDSGEVLLEVDGGVAVVTLNAPDRRNALTPAMADELIATFDEVDARADVGALVIKATGKSFCAGGDIATLTSAGLDPAAPDAYEGMGRIYDSFYRLGQVRVPTVAAVRGSAVGNFRKEVVNGAVGWDVATQFERPAQMWSMRRSAR